MPTLRRPARPTGSATRSPWAWALGGILVGALPTLAVFAPAQWLADGMAQTSGQRVLLAGVRGTVWTGSGQLQVQVQAHWNGAHISVTDGQSHWPAAMLAGLGTPWNTLQPQGQLALETRGLQVDWAAGRMVLEGQAQLDALSMSSRLSTLRPMGSYRLTLQGGATPTLGLQTLQGALQLSGSGQWVGQRLRFTRGQRRTRA